MGGVRVESLASVLAREPGLVERLIGRRLTGLLGRRSVPRWGGASGMPVTIRAGAVP